MFLHYLFNVWAAYFNNVCFKTQIDIASFFLFLSFEHHLKFRIRQDESPVRPVASSRERIFATSDGALQTAEPLHGRGQAAPRAGRTVGARRHRGRLLHQGLQQEVLLHRGT